jgi:hypothetical protein
MQRSWRHPPVEKSESSNVEEHDKPNENGELENTKM